MIHDDATWTMVGDPETCFFGGVHSKQKVKNILEEFIGEFERFSFDILNSFAADETVAVRGISHGVRSDGHEYKNDYLMQYIVKDNKIAMVVEFFNPLQVFKYMGIAAPV